MTFRLAKFAGAGAIAALMSTTPLAAQDAAIDWDADQDQAVSQQEFQTGWSESGSFGSWDQDQSGSISDEEFSQGVAAVYDRDQSGDLDENEMAELEQNEWADTAMSDWDADQSGELDEQEFGEGVFGEYDADQSGDWNEDETAMFQDDADEQGFWDW